MFTSTYSVCHRCKKNVFLPGTFFILVKFFYVFNVFYFPKVFLFFKKRWQSSGARFTKYLTTILRLSYDNRDNAIVTIDLRQTTNLPNRLTEGERLFLGMIHLQNCKIA